MYIHWYKADAKPEYIDDGGYFYIDGYAIGFSESNNTASTLISLVTALTKSMLGHTRDADGDNLTVEEIETAVDAFFTNMGFTVTAGDITNAETAVNEVLLNEARETRNTLLVNSDWTQLVDSPLSSEDKGAWATYRQDLRDLPEDNSTVLRSVDIIWPTEPL